MTRSTTQRVANRQRTRRKARTRVLITLLVAVPVAVLIGLAVYAKLSAAPSTPHDSQAAQPSGPVASSRPNASTSAGPTVVRPDESKMRQELVDFVGKYYHEDYQDHTQDRVDAVGRLSLTITKEARDSMDFTVYTSSVADQLRINDRMTVSGAINPADITVRARQLNGSRLYVSVPVTVTYTLPNHKVYERYVVTVGTVWLWQPATNPAHPWSMTAFGEDGKLS